ncbi:MAG TPA: hypothetical protein VM779_10450 [Thermoanaerobaculia bacterium]|nr:hypothetical protein [Thermoanaerobaculia bacterium]
MRKRLALHFLMLMLLPAALPAMHFGDLYVIPVAGHVRGAHGSLWQTDVAVHNFQSTTLTVELAVAESGEAAADNFSPVSISGSTTITIPAGGSRILRDVLANHRGQIDTIGALIVGADAPFAVTSRTYNVAAAGVMTAGFSVPPIQEFLSTPSAMAFVPGLISNVTFRTNIGITAAAGAAAPLVVEVSLLNAAGGMLGSRTFTVPAGAINHIQLGSGAFSAAAYDEATAAVRIVSGSGDVVAYGSVIENSTNHAVFVSGIVPTPASAESTESVFASLFQHIHR